MFLGTSRPWWIAAALFFVLGIALVTTGTGGTLGSVGGVLLVIAAVVLFGAAPMRYGRSRSKPPPESSAPAAPATPADAAPQPRVKIEGGDPNEV
jgi:drug/metabolite transporter (DMT)-like permease